MGKNLTKNARWIILWARFKDKDDTHDIFIPHEVAFNVGRHSYNTPTMIAINNTLDFSKDMVLSSRVYEVDVAVFPYARQHAQVTALAQDYFNRPTPNTLLERSTK
jgi:hypothetical protein